MPNFGNKRGFTLPLTIVLLVFISFLTFSLYDMVKRERMESARRYKKLQAELELESGVNYAFYRMQKEGKPWRTDSLQHSSKDRSINFTLSQIQDGPFAKLSVFNKDSTESFLVRTGFIPNSRPALTILASQTNVSLVGKAKIEGGSAIQNGSISYSTHYKMRAGKEAFHDTVYTGENLPYFDTLKFFPELSKNQFTNKFENEQCVFDGSDFVGNGVKDQASCKTVIMQGDSRCEECSISADRIFIRGRASLQNAKVTARIISLKDSAKVSGIFFAQDTLEVSLLLEQYSPIKLIVQGEKTGEVDYSGLFVLNKLKAKDALTIFMADNWDETMKGVPFQISENVDIRGAVISRGTVDFRGKLTGQMIAYNFGFYDGNTFWRGFLRDGQIKGDTTYHPFLPDIVYLGGEASYEK